MDKDFVLQELLQRNRFEFGFMGLILGTIALSFQFSTKMGKGYIFILILAWVFLLLSALIGAYRLFKIIEFSNLNNLQVYDFIINEKKDINSYERLSSERNKLDKSLYSKFKLQSLYYFFGIILNGFFALLLFRIKVFKKVYLIKFDWIFSSVFFVVALIITLILCLKDKK